MSSEPTAAGQINDPDVISDLLHHPGTWAVVGLSANRSRTAYRISDWMQSRRGAHLVAIHPRAESVLDSPAYPSLADIPDQPIRVVDCFVNSDLVGAVVDAAIAQKDRLQIEAVWLQLGVIDEAAAERALAAGLAVVMDTCPKIEWPRVAHRA